jgi:5-formyltetrahydrofolate cyclo-ligase
MDIAEAKRALRAQALAKRKALPAENAKRAARAVLDLALAEVPFPRGATVAGYWPLADELDVRPLLEALAKRGHPCALPVVVARGHALAFRAWKPGDPLEQAGFGLSVPRREAPASSPAVLLVPLLAFDSRGYRIGFGAGFYDMTINALRAKGRLLAVGIGFAAQEVSMVPTETFDAALDWLVTERAARKAVPAKP